MNTPGTFKAGIGRRKITPPIGAEMGGYMHKRFARDIKSDLYAKAMCIEHDSRRIMLASVDLGRASTNYTQPARELIAANCGVAPEAILIAATHTHSCPCVEKWKGLEPDPIPGYTDILIQALAGAAQDACVSMFDATLSFGLADAAGYSINKLSRTKDGRDVYRQPKPDDPEIIGASGRLDTSVQVVCARDSNQAARAFIVNYAAHPNRRVDSFWAEWPGEMAKTLVAVYGKNTQCLFLQGTAGDVDCQMRIPGEAIGRGIAGAAMLAIERVSAPMPPGPLAFRMKKINIPRLVKTPETDRMIEALRKKPDANYLEKYWPICYDAWEAEPAAPAVPVQCLRIGDVAIVGLPGEAFTALGLEIKRYSPAAHTMVVAYANDHVGYIPPVGQAERGGYGEWPFLTRRLIPQAATMMTDAAIAMLHEMWADSSNK